MKNSKIVSGLTQQDEWVYEGKKTKQFLARFEVYAKQEEIEKADYCDAFSLFVKPRIWDRVTRLASFKAKSWEEFKKELKDTFVDEELDVYLPTDLQHLVKKQKLKGRPATYSDIMAFQLKFSKISSYLVERESISKQDETRYFLKALEPTVVDLLEQRAAAKSVATSATRNQTVGDDDANRVERVKQRVPGLKEVIRDIKELFEASHAYGGMRSGSKLRRSQTPILSDSEESEDERITIKSSKRRSPSPARKTRFAKQESDESSESEDDEISRLPKVSFRPRVDKKTNEKVHKEMEHAQEMDDIVNRLRSLEVEAAQLKRINQSQQRQLSFSTGRGLAPPRRYEQYNARQESGILPTSQLNDNSYRRNVEPNPNMRCHWCQVSHVRRECKDVGTG